MPASVNMDIHVDSADVEKMIGREVERLSKVDEALAEVAVAILKNNEDAWGRRWAPLSDSRKEQKDKAGLSDEPEVATGKYKDSITRPGAEGQVHEIADDTLRLGTEVWYARFQKGTKHQPKRPGMRLTPTVKAAIRETLHKKLMPGERE